MTHRDPELLALIALGEDVATAADREHLASCALCRDEVDRSARAVAAARRAAEPLTPPPSRIWEGIAAELGLAAAPEPLADRPGGDRGRGRPAGAPVARPSAPASASPAARPARRPRRASSRRAVGLAAAALVVVLVAVGSAVVLLRQSQPQTVATAVLAPFPDWPGRSGTAVLERLADGRQVVAVRAAVGTQPDVDHEVWLMTDGARRLVSLGLLHGSSGTFAVPAGTDVSRFRYVDVSAEPRDGDPAHSGDSIVRGPLRS